MRNFEAHIQIDVGDYVEETDYETMNELTMLLEEALSNYSVAIDIYPTNNEDY
jgi:hypothetical protein